MTSTHIPSNELAAKCAVLVGRLYEMHGWVWGGWGRDDGYTPEAEAIAQTIKHLLDDVEDHHTLATGRLMVMDCEGDKTVYLQLGYMDKCGYVRVDNERDAVSSE